MTAKIKTEKCNILAKRPGFLRKTGAFPLRIGEDCARMGGK